MQAKEYMIRVRKAEQELLRLASRRRHYLDMMQSMGSDPAADRVQHGISSKTENVAVGLAALAEKMEQRSREYAQIVTEAEPTLSCASRFRCPSLASMVIISSSLFAPL